MPGLSGCPDRHCTLAHGGVPLFQTRFSVIRDDSLAPAPESTWFTDNEESGESCRQLIRDHPLTSAHIHIWEFRVFPGSDDIEHQVERPSARESGHYHQGSPLDRDRMPFRIHIQRTLAGYLGCVPSEIRISHGKNGQPLLRNLLHPYQFSLSYTHGKGILVLSRECFIGVDVEYVQDNPRLLAIAKRFFHPAEWNRIRSLPHSERKQVFFELWTLKEAYLKVIGTGWSGWRHLPDMAGFIGNAAAATPGPIELPGPYRAWVWMEGACCQALVSSRRS